MDPNADMGVEGEIVGLGNSYGGAVGEWQGNPGGEQQAVWGTGRSDDWGNKKDRVRGKVNTIKLNLRQKSSHYQVS